MAALNWLMADGWLVGTARALGLCLADVAVHARQQSHAWEWSELLGGPPTSVHACILRRHPGAMKPHRRTLAHAESTAGLLGHTCHSEDGLVPLCGGGAITGLGLVCTPTLVEDGAGTPVAQGWWTLAEHLVCLEQHQHVVT